MKNFKKRKCNLPDYGFLQNHDVSKKQKADVLSYENQCPIDWHEVKIILDATVVERYLNNQKSSGITISPSHREKISFPKVPQSNQRIFSEKNNVMVKLEIPDDVRVDENSSPEDSLHFDDVPVKKEELIPLQDPFDKNTSHNKELIEPLNEDFQCKDRDHFTVETALKNEVVKSECCYEKTIVDHEVKDALTNEELFVSEEFKHEASIPIYENVESINEEITKKNTRSIRKRKKCLDCDDCYRGFLRKARVPSKNKALTPKILKNSKTRRSKSKIHAKKQKTNQRNLHIASPSIQKPKPYKYRVYYCDHCNYKGLRGNLIWHLRNKHLHLYPKDSIHCVECDVKFDSWEEMQRHRPVCLRFLVCKFCLINEPSKREMVMHMKAMHPEAMYGKNGDRIVDKVGLYSMTAVKTLELTPFGRRYMEIKKYYTEMECELIKLYCPKCVVTHDKIMSRTAPNCEICNSRLLFQCQKCKFTRAHHRFIWKHLTTETSDCSIPENVSITDHKERSNKTYQASPGKPKRHDCQICDFKGSSTTQLDEHVLNAHMENGIIRNGYYTCFKCGATFHVGDVGFRKHQELCDIAFRYPCRFCPMTCYRTTHLSDHIETMHPEELDGKDVNEFLQEVLDFRRMVKEVNLVRFHAKLRIREAETETDYYHDGIESMLQPVCIKCKTGGPQEGAHCADCQARLNFVCLKCDEKFANYSTAWVHVTRMCEKRCFTLTTGETTSDPVNESEGTIRRSFSENIKLVAFYCENCDDTVHKDCKFIADTKTCTKCNGKLRLHCKICSKAYARWESMTHHFQSSDCGDVNIETCNLDHLYCLRQPPSEVTTNLEGKV